MSRNELDHLVSKLDLLLATHRNIDAGAAAQLRELRDDLKRLAEARQHEEFATKALRVATLIKFIFDQLGGDP